ncbi:MAG TPA: hypothetical protein PLX97_08155 [Gemmatales bacterium]|nr:hypothetical protein [Gemmatales bacterium]
MCYTKKSRWKRLNIVQLTDGTEDIVPDVLAQIVDSMDVSDKPMKVLIKTCMITRDKFSERSIVTQLTTHD